MVDFSKETYEGNVPGIFYVIVNDHNVTNVKYNFGEYITKHTLSKCIVNP